MKTRSSDLQTSIVKTRSIDVECPECGSPPTLYCKGEGVGFHRERVKLAMKTTREANAKARASKL